MENLAVRIANVGLQGRTPERRARAISLLAQLDAAEDRERELSARAMAGELSAIASYENVHRELCALIEEGRRLCARG
jgi:hypothetical protein